MIAVADRCAALQHAFDRLRDEHDVLGARVRVDLSRSTGLSAPMIDWGLRTTLPDDVTVLHEAMSQVPAHRADHARRLAVILSGNVFTACVRALSWPLLLGWHVTAKTASGDGVLTHALKQMLDETAGELGARLRVLSFDRHDHEATRRLLQQSDAVSVYGDDDTIATIAAQLRQRSVPVIAHGHGFGVLFVEPTVLSDPDTTRSWAARVALDVAAYDQRGCLSPQVIYVRTDRAGDLERFAAALHMALHELNVTLPRGPLPADVAVAQAQWRGLMAASGTLHEGVSSAVAIAHDTRIDAPIAPSPGYRNIELRACASMDAWLDALQPYHAHLKACGVVGASIDRVRDALPERLRSTVCVAGEMQTPRFGAWADCAPPWFGLL